MQHEVRTVRILSEPDIDLSAGPLGDIIVRADVIAVIHHRKQDTYAGAVTWRLVRADACLKIKSKRVDLLNADAPLDSIMMYIKRLLCETYILYHSRVTSVTAQLHTGTSFHGGRRESSQ